MAKIKRYQKENYVYYVTSVTKYRRPIFRDTIYARHLLGCIAYFHFTLDFKLLGYVIMPDHFHLLIQASKNCISRIMKLIKGNFARRYNELLEQKGSIWQRRFYDNVLRDKKQIQKKLIYMHRNPLIKGLVDNPGDYEFSSYQQYNKGARKYFQIPIDPIL